MATIFVVVDPNNFYYAWKILPKIKRQLPLVNFVVNETNHKDQNSEWWDTTHVEIYACSLVLAFVNDDKGLDFAVAHFHLADRFNKRIIAISLSDKTPDHILHTLQVNWIKREFASNVDYVVDTILELLEDESTSLLEEGINGVEIRDPEDLETIPVITNLSIFKLLLNQILKLFVNI